MSSTSLLKLLSRSVRLLDTSDNLEAAGVLKTVLAPTTPGNISRALEITRPDHYVSIQI